MKLLDQFVVRTLPFVPKPIVGRLSRPYIAGDNLQAALDCVHDLNGKGFTATIDILGEFVENLDQARETMAGYKQVLGAIHANGLKANISVKPTSFGLLRDRKLCTDLLAELMEDVEAHGSFMRLDMEDSPCTDATIDLYETFRPKYGRKVGIVLQSYLRRTLDDIRHIVGGGFSHFRLCKGIYVEPPAVAFQNYQKVRRNFLDALAAMFDAGAFVGIATHDDFLVEEAQKMIRKRGLGEQHYEFQMLLGVREKLRDQIKADGHNLRIYVPFGKEWYGYSIRRLKENPALAGTFFKAMFVRK